MMQRKSFLNYVCGVLAVLGVMLSTGCGKGKSASNRIIVGQNIGMLMSLDPAECYELSGVEVIFNCYERLFVRKGKEFVNELVKSYQYDQSKGTLRVELMRNHVFASGNPLTAEDVVFSLQRAINLQKGGASMLQPMGLTPKNVRACVRYISPNVVEIDVPNKISEELLLSCLASSGGAIVDSVFVKNHQVKDDCGNQWLRTKTAGSGPLILAEWRVGDSIALKKNSHYMSDTPLQYTSVIIRHIGDISTQMLCLNSGEIDVARNLSAEYLESLDPEKYTIVSEESGAVFYINLNQKNEYLKDPRVCAAIRLLIDRKAVCAALGAKMYAPLATMLPSCFQGALNICMPEYNPAKARKIIHDAYGGDITIAIDCDNLPVAQVLQSAFAEGGIILKVHYSDSKQLVMRLRNHTHTLCPKTVFPDYVDPQALVSFFCTNVPGSNFYAQRNNITLPKKVEELAEKCQQLSGPARTQALEQLQKEMDVVPCIFVASGKSAAAHNKNIEGLFFEGGELIYKGMKKTT